MCAETMHLKHPLYRHAHLTGWACRLAAISIPALTLFAWYIGTAKVALLRGLGLEMAQQLSAMQVVLIILISLLPTLALARSLFSIAKCFDCFAGDHWFGPTQPLALVKAGRWLFISGLLVFIVPTLLGLLISLNAPAGERSLVVSLSSNGVLSILIGLLLWSLGDLWTKANSLAAENARFV